MGYLDNLGIDTGGGGARGLPWAIDGHSDCWVRYLRDGRKDCILSRAEEIAQLVPPVLSCFFRPFGSALICAHVRHVTGSSPREKSIAMQWRENSRPSATSCRDSQRTSAKVLI